MPGATKRRHPVKAEDDSVSSSAMSPRRRESKSAMGSQIAPFDEGRQLPCHATRVQHRLEDILRFLVVDGP